MTKKLEEKATLDAARDAYHTAFDAFAANHSDDNAKARDDAYAGLRAAAAFYASGGLEE